MNNWHRVTGTATGPSRWVYGPEPDEGTALVLIDAIGSTVLTALTRKAATDHWVGTATSVVLAEAKTALAPQVPEPKPIALADCVWKRTHNRGAAGRWLYGPKGCTEATALVIVDRTYATQRGRHMRVIEDRAVWLYHIRIRNTHTGEFTEHRLWGELAAMWRPPIRRVQAWTVKRLNGRHPGRAPVERPTPQLEQRRQPGPGIHTPTTGLHPAVRAQ